MDTVSKSMASVSGKGTSLRKNVRMSMAQWQAGSFIAVEMFLYFFSVPSWRIKLARTGSAHQALGHCAAPFLLSVAYH